MPYQTRPWPSAVSDASHKGCKGLSLRGARPLLHNGAMKRRPLLLGALAAAGADPWLARAQTGRPIRLIVPYAAGGPIDATARVLAERVKDSLGTIIIENR